MNSIWTCHCWFNTTLHTVLWMIYGMSVVFVCILCFIICCYMLMMCNLCENVWHWWILNIEILFHICCYEWRFVECIILFYELTSGSKFNILLKLPIKHKLCSILEYLKCFVNITFLSIVCICWICASRIV